MDSEKSNKNVKSSTKNIGLFVGIGLLVLLLLFGVGRAMGVGRSTTTGGGTNGGTNGGRTIIGSPSPLGGGSDNEESWLEAHNVIRRLAHNVNDDSVDLEWSSELADQAKEYAESMAESGIFDHSNTTNQQVCDPDKTTDTPARQPNKCGENLSKDWGNSVPVTPMETVQRWYDECEVYKGYYTSGSGHYTQVVWKNAKKVGCAYATNNMGEQYGVCLYDTGNINVNDSGFDIYVPKEYSCDAQS